MQQDRASGKSVENEATRRGTTRSRAPRPAVTQPKDPSLGADTQLTTGYIPSARWRRTRGKKGREKEMGASRGRAKRAATLRMGPSGARPVLVRRRIGPNGR